MNDREKRILLYRLRLILALVVAAGMVSLVFGLFCLILRAMHVE